MFYTRVPEATDDARTARLRALLSEDEQARQLRFYFPHDRESYLIAHALTRSVLGAALGLAPSALRFELGPHGRPELAPGQSDLGLRFNLSHARGMVACAIALERDVGVDVEQVDRRVEIAQLARQVFSDSERAALFALGTDAQRERFFRLWTLKEGYIKAVGKGLAIPLRCVSLQLDDPGAIRVMFSPPVEDDAAAWQFRTYWPTPGHMISVAARDAQPLQFSLREAEV